MPADLLIVDKALLALVFAVAAAAKLMRRREFQRALPAFGVPERLAPAVSVGIPFVEAAVGLLLIVGATGRSGALAALVLLGAFSLGLAVVILRGEGAVCDCFGSLSSSKPAGSWTLARNIVLIAGAAAVVAARPRGSSEGPLTWLGHLPAVEGLLTAWVAIVSVALTALLFLLIRLTTERQLLQTEVALLRSGDPPTPYKSGAGLPLGWQAPRIDLLDRNGGEVALASIAETRRPLLVLFTATKCKACHELAGDLERWHAAVGEQVGLVTVNRGGEPFDLPADYIALDPGGRVARAFQSRGTPSAVLVTPEWKIAAGLARGAASVRQLLRTVAETLGSAAGRDAATGDQTGRPLPALTVTAPDGRATELAGGEQTILFVDPVCPYSRQLVSELSGLWQDDEPEPRLTTVARGREDSPALVLPQPFFTDPDGSVFRGAGVRATPAALVIGTDRTVVVHARGLTQVRHVLGLDGATVVR